MNDQSAETLVPDELRSSWAHLARRSAERLARIPSDSGARQWYTSLIGRANIARLAAMRGRLAGERCFILGNGPSLAETDLSRLRDEWVIGLNRIYLHPASAHWRRWLYCCVNPHVIEQFHDEITSVPTLKFLPWECRRRLRAATPAVWLRTRHEPRFSFDLTDAMWQGGTVTYVALQVAFHLGFREVILLGVDHSFVETGPPNALVRSDAPDRNHFSPEYFGPGTRWQLPDLEQSETAYRLARQAFEQEGRRICNATIGGRLEVFRRVRYDELF